MKKILFCLISLSVLAGCQTSPPEALDNVCDIFREKKGWYADAEASKQRWDVPISVMMAFMHQESRFVAGAKPPRKQIWGFIPGIALVTLTATRKQKIALGIGISVSRVTTVPTVTSFTTPWILSAGTTI